MRPTPGLNYYNYLCELSQRSDIQAYPPASPDHIAEMAACLISIPTELQTEFVIQVQDLMRQTLSNLPQPTKPELIWSNPKA